MFHLLLLYICHTLQSEVHDDSCDDGRRHRDYGAAEDGWGGVALVRGAGVDAGPVLLKNISFLYQLLLILFKFGRSKLQTQILEICCKHQI